jgi:cobalamin synthase
MNTLLFGIIISALFSLTSLLVVLLRVSPLTAPQQAVPAFFVSLLLSVSTVATLVLIGIWKLLPIHTWDMGKLTSTALRQGIFIGVATAVVVLFHLLNLLTWWIAVMIYAVVVLVELALEH